MNRESTDGLQTLEALIPTSLDDVIRTNRDRARLYFTTEEELAALADPAPPSADRHVKGVLTEWSFVTLTIAGEQGVILLGYNTTARQTWGTSVVTGIAGSLVHTRSGSLYQLEGPPTDQPDLLHLCALLWSWGLGGPFGVPHIYY